MGFSPSVRFSYFRCSGLGTLCKHSFGVDMLSRTAEARVLFGVSPLAAKILG